MNRSETDNSVLRKLESFDSLEDIVPSSSWEQTLFRKLETANTLAESKVWSKGISVLALAFVLVNASVLFYVSKSSHGNLLTRDSEYETLSSQFLINPILVSQ